MKKPLTITEIYTNSDTYEEFEKQVMEIGYDADAASVFYEELQRKYDDQ